jgi:hypothetical protein
MRVVSAEFLLTLGYAIALAGIALLLECVAKHAHKRSMALATTGFTYHPDRDVWRCPQDQHLFPIFSDSAKGRVVYRAPATACNSCKSKAACTDSNHGRELERQREHGPDYGMQQFHHAVSITLMVLASVLLSVELIRSGSRYEQVSLWFVLMTFCGIIRWLLTRLKPNGERSARIT